MSITSDVKVGDKIEHEGEKGKVKEIIGDGKVAVVEIPVTTTKTVYVTIPPPPPPPDPEPESPSAEG